MFQIEHKTHEIDEIMPDEKYLTFVSRLCNIADIKTQPKDYVETVVFSKGNKENIHMNTLSLYTLQEVCNGRIETTGIKAF